MAKPSRIISLGINGERKKNRKSQKDLFEDKKCLWIHSIALKIINIRFYCAELFGKSIPNL